MALRDPQANIIENPKTIQHSWLNNPKNKFQAPIHDDPTSKFNVSPKRFKWLVNAMLHMPKIRLMD